MPFIWSRNRSLMLPLQRSCLKHLQLERWTECCICVTLAFEQITTCSPVTEREGDFPRCDGMRKKMCHAFHYCQCREYLLPCCMPWGVFQSQKRSLACLSSLFQEVLFISDSGMSVKLLGFHSSRSQLNLCDLCCSDTWDEGLCHFWIQPLKLLCTGCLCLTVALSSSQK